MASVDLWGCVLHLGPAMKDTIHPPRFPPARNTKPTSTAWRSVRNGHVGHSQKRFLPAGSKDLVELFERPPNILAATQTLRSSCLGSVDGTTTPVAPFRLPSRCRLGSRRWFTVVGRLGRRPSPLWTRSSRRIAPF